MSNNILLFNKRDGEDMFKLPKKRAEKLIDGVDFVDDCVDETTEIEPDKLVRAYFSGNTNFLATEADFCHWGSWLDGFFKNRKHREIELSQLSEIEQKMSRLIAKKKKGEIQEKNFNNDHKAIHRDYRCYLETLYETSRKIGITSQYRKRIRSAISSSLGATVGSALGGVLGGPPGSVAGGIAGGLSWFEIDRRIGDTSDKVFKFGEQIVAPLNGDRRTVLYYFDQL